MWTERSIPVKRTRGVAPLSKPYYIGILRLPGLKTDIDFAHFGLESGMVFEGTMNVFIVSILNE